MKNVMIFSGTTEGRALSLFLSENKIPHTVSVATDYGEKLCEASPFAVIRKGRMDADAMQAFFKEKKIDVVIDATHPYAAEVTKNIKEAAKITGVRYLRYVRNTDITDLNTKDEKIRYFESAEACAKGLYETKGNILLTTGSKELSCFCSDEKLKSRLVARVLPGIESITLCEKNGLLGRQIVAMQGPFTYEMNMLMIKQFDILCMVTKQSGRIGGFEEKYLAAVDAGIELFIIGNKETETGNTIEEICNELGIDNPAACEKTGLDEMKNPKAGYGMNIALIGCGMGTDALLTNEALKFIEEADIILGAERLIRPYRARMDKKPFYLSEDIIPYLEKINDKKDIKADKLKNEKINIAVLFSGDTGFYSGADKLLKALNKAVYDKKIYADIRLMPGISSVSYLASRLCISWNDSRIMSIHGRKDAGAWKKEFLDAVTTYKKTFILLSGLNDLKMLISLLKDNKLKSCELYAGYQMSYEEERIIKLGQEEFEDENITDGFDEGLYTCLIINNDKPLSVYIGDEAFKRGNVPMTKEEVRSLSIAKLGLESSSILYDVGSGTGSIAVQTALMSDGIRVYAIEKKHEAAELIRENCRLFKVDNVTVCGGEAPKAFDDLPVPTHAFIGGSGGSLIDILTKLYEKNPEMRIVINAVSTETMQLCMELEKMFHIKDFSMVQVGITRLNKVGEHHLLKSENPIWICSFSFTEEEL